jgi:ADP-ribosylglycohydrolase
VGATSDDLNRIAMGRFVIDLEPRHENQPGPLVPRWERAGQLSDDTQLTLATCGAFCKHSRIDPAAIAATMLEWFQARKVTGIGSATLEAMRRLAAGSPWALAGRKGEMAAGNGAAMRIAPLAFFCDPLDAGDRVVLRDVCRITHHNDEAYAGALAVLLAIRFSSKTPEKPCHELVRTGQRTQHDQDVGRIRVETSTPGNVMKPLGPYSRAARAGRFVALSATAGVDPNTCRPEPSWR